MTTLVSSVSVQWHSTHTHWFPCLTSGALSSSYLLSEEGQVAASNQQRKAIVTANLTAPQTTLVYAQTDPRVFFPNVGLFLTDIALGSIAYNTDSKTFATKTRPKQID